MNEWNTLDAIEMECEKEKIEETKDFNYEERCPFSVMENK